MLKVFTKSLLAPHRKKDPDLIDCGLSGPIREGEYNFYKKLHLDPVSIKPLNIADLKCAISLDYDDILRPFFRRPGGGIDRAITNSPQFKLLKYYQAHGLNGLRRNFRESDYYKLLMSSDKRYKTNFFNPSEKIPIHHTDKTIWKIFLSLIELFEGIRRDGYLNGPHRGSYISALEVPIVVTRFGVTADYEPFEIFRGHRRAASLAALGYEGIDVLILKDVKGLRHD